MVGSKIPCHVDVFIKLPEFGCAKVIHGSTLEITSKFFIKRLGMQSKKRSDVFASQVATNEFAYFMIKLVYECIKNI
jgi:hypothetical protein